MTPTDRTPRSRAPGDRGLEDRPVAEVHAVEEPDRDHRRLIRRAGAPRSRARPASRRAYRRGTVAGMRRSPGGRGGRGDRARAAAACDVGGTTPPAPDEATISIASFDFDESEVTAELYAGALRAAGFDVRHVRRVGRTRGRAAGPRARARRMSCPSTRAAPSSSSAGRRPPTGVRRTKPCEWRSVREASMPSTWLPRRAGTASSSRRRWPPTTGCARSATFVPSLPA